jgi:type VI secretion system protein ImpF
MSTAIGKRSNVAPPLMYAFRSAHQERATRDPKNTATVDGERVVVSRRSSRAPITEPLLRQQVSRDLGALVNTINLASAVNLDGFEAVKVSILNYGLPDVTSRFYDQLSDGQLARDLEEAVRRYEPRLVGKTLRVKPEYRTDEATMSVRFEISADLVCEPVSVPVTFLADVEMASGKIAISRLATR